MKLVSLRPLLNKSRLSSNLKSRLPKKLHFKTNRVQNGSTISPTTKETNQRKGATVQVGKRTIIVIASVVNITRKGIGRATEIIAIEEMIIIDNLRGMMMFIEEIIIEGEETVLQLQGNATIRGLDLVHAKKIIDMISINVGTADPGLDHQADRTNVTETTETRKITATETEMTTDTTNAMTVEVN